MRVHTLFKYGMESVIEPRNNATSVWRGPPIEKRTSEYACGTTKSREKEKLTAHAWTNHNPQEIHSVTLYDLSKRPSDAVVLASTAQAATEKNSL